jgi:hypothetical protein
MGCNTLWISQLQTVITLSSRESEYIGLSYALTEVILLMRPLEEMKGLGFPISITTSNISARCSRTTMEPWKWQEPTSSDPVQNISMLSYIISDPSWEKETFPSMQYPKKSTSRASHETIAGRQIGQVEKTSSWMVTSIYMSPCSIHMTARGSVRISRLGLISEHARPTREALECHRLTCAKVIDLRYLEVPTNKRS